MKRKFFAPRKPKESDPFVRVEVFLPKSLVAMLKAVESERFVPVSRLIGYAVDNEFDSEHPFNYPFALPTTPFEEYRYADEAGKILRYLREGFPPSSGVGIDQLLLHRRDMDIHDRERVLEGIRQLLHSTICELATPGGHYRYHPTYKYLRLVKDERPAPMRKTKLTPPEGS